MLFRAYPVYTVGESTTLYPIANTAQGQGQYYAATNSGATTVSGTVGYTTTGGQYVVQHTVEAEPIIASQRVSPQTTNAVREILIFQFFFIFLLTYRPYI